MNTEPHIINDSFWSNLPVLITSLSGALLALLAFLRAGRAAKTSGETKKEVVGIHEKIDGLLEEKTKADKAIGAKEATNLIEKTASDIQAGVEKGVKQEQDNQALRDLPPK